MAEKKKPKPFNLDIPGGAEGFKALVTGRTQDLIAKMEEPGFLAMMKFQMGPMAPDGITTITTEQFCANLIAKAKEELARQSEILTPQPQAKTRLFSVAGPGLNSGDVVLCDKHKNERIKAGQKLGVPTSTMAETGLALGSTKKPCADCTEVDGFLPAEKEKGKPDYDMDPEIELP